MSSVCRVCLVGYTRLHSLENNLLISIYEKLSNAKFNSEDASPRVLCYSCYQELHRCHTFSQMVCRSEKIFSNLFHKGLVPTHDNITEADRQIQQHLSSATVQFGTTDGNATHAESQITIKDEPISNYDIEEEMTTEQNKLVEVTENCTKIQLRLEEYQSDQHNQPNQLTIKYEPIESIDVKEEGKLIEVNEMSQDHEDCFKLTFHPENYSNQGNEVVEKLNINVQQIEPDISKMQFCCNDCQKIFFLKSELISHIRSMHSIYTMKTSLNEDIDNRNNQFSCNVCDKQFNDNGKLVAHMRIHTGEKPFACNVCDKQFRQLCTLVKHMKVHTCEKLFMCYVCDKQFIEKSQLIKHNEITVHTGEKPFACDLCDKQFRRKCDLAMHKRIHTGENLFTCQICDKKFNKKCDFVNHMLLHTGEKPFACNVCDKRFRRKCDLDRHKKIHTGEKPFACNLCYERFRRKCALVVHMRTHTGEKPFACNVCDKQYNRKFELRRHSVIHTGEKPFSCNVCNKQFNLKCNLKRHMRVHTE